MSRYLYPRATIALLPEARTQAAIRPTQLILHTIVGSARSAINHFRASALESHFVLPFHDVPTQLMPANVRADANAGANRRPDGTGAISVETEDGGKPDTTPWTASQSEELVRLILWARDLGVPTRICRTADDPGIGYHSLHRAWNPNAHTCPGKARKEQFGWLVLAAAVRAGDIATQSPVPVPASSGLAQMAAGLDAAARSTIRRGSTGDAVWWCQALLKGAGYWIDPMAGPEVKRFGAVTDAFVRDFQSKVQRFFRLPAATFPVDGIVGPHTWAWLRLAASSPSPS